MSILFRGLRPLPFRQGLLKRPGIPLVFGIRGGEKVGSVERGIGAEIQVMMRFGIQDGLQAGLRRAGDRSGRKSGIEVCIIW